MVGRVVSRERITFRGGIIFCKRPQPSLRPYAVRICNVIRTKGFSFNYFFCCWITGNVFSRIVDVTPTDHKWTLSRKNLDPNPAGSDSPTFPVLLFIHVVFETQQRKKEDFPRMAPVVSYLDIYIFLQQKFWFICQGSEQFFLLSFFS